MAELKDLKFEVLEFVIEVFDLVDRAL